MTNEERMAHLDTASRKAYGRPFAACTKAERAGIIRIVRRALGIV